MEALAALDEVTVRAAVNKLMFRRFKLDLAVSDTPDAGLPPLPLSISRSILCFLCTMVVVMSGGARVRLVRVAPAAPADLLRCADAIVARASI
jgi:hypothetical protein